MLVIYNVAMIVEVKKSQLNKEIKRKKIISMAFQKTFDIFFWAMILKYFFFFSSKHI